MNSFVVKGKVIRYFWIPVVSVLVAYFATMNFFNLLASNPENVMSIFVEIFVAALYLCVCRCCIIAMEFYVATVLAKVEVNGREITIKKFLQKPETIDVKKLDGYRIEDITEFSKNKHKSRNGTCDHGYIVLGRRTDQASYFLG